ncbi:sulfatase family protein [Paenibacillus koleovorans]|uniref:sulfatase family protein n=1 Tax=Paenibacillus koleovorans TaxID=121608 RepID=UPI000FDB0381|nr:sulfatase-like hydrolase/transferase [Paenibacillus koleovorans]
MSTKKQPNVLLLFPDSHRGDWMPYDSDTLQAAGLEQLGGRMPNIRKLMDRGVTFTHAVTPAPLCAPARACLAAGVRYEQCGTPSNEANFPLDKRTFYSVLREAGYRVGAVGKFDLHKPVHWWGLNGWLDELETLGFTDGIDNAGKIDAVVSGKEEPKDPYMKYLHDRGLAELHVQDMTGRRGHGTAPTELPEDAYCDNWLTSNGLQLLSEFPADQPWFLMVNFTGPHGPWDITKSMKEAWEGVPLPLPNRWDKDTDELAVEIRRNYAAMLENIDRNIGLLLEEIERRGELDNTIVIYTSDHGEMLGDFNRFGKCVPYRGSVHIPLVVSGPGMREGVLTPALVELQDLAATIVEYADAAMPEAVGSMSLKHVLEGGTEQVRTYQVAGLDADGRHTKHTWRMIADDRYKLHLTDGAEPELYDIAADPWENRNIAGEQPETMERLQRLAVEG